MVSANQSATAQIEQTTRQFLERRVQSYASQLKAESYDIELQLPPGTDRLAVCPDTLVTVPAVINKKPLGRYSLKVRCEKTSRWSLLVKADISLFVPVVTSLNELERDQLISEADLTLETQNIASLNSGYFTQLDDVAGQRAKRRIGADQIITQRFIKLNELVRKGEKVIIEAGSSQFSVSMQGVSLGKGQLGDQVSVKNLSSGKVIQAEVVGKNRVKAD